MTILSDSQPAIILVCPQLAENIGMTARAMMNCGLSNLRLVNPRENHLSDKAIAASSGADEILRNAVVYASVKDAVADLNAVYATTARRRNQIKTIYTAETVMKPVHNLLNSGNKCGIMFGPERTGLENDDVSIADAIIEIPLNPKHCSLNLSQAVLLVGYEWYKSIINVPEAQFITNATRLANKEQLTNFFAFLEHELQDFKNLQDEEKRPTLLRNLHNIFTRSNLTEQDINTLYGIIRYLHKK
jgi:tRNA/rRNA methyltransferase